MRIAGVIAALDCASTIARVTRGVREHVRHVLVVDDGSSDATATLARRAGAEILRHPLNEGKGRAVLSGLRRLHGHGFSHAVTIDGDGEHLACEIPKLLSEARRHPDAFVIGERRVEGEVAALRRLGNRVANWSVRIAAGADLGDTQCGLRTYPIPSVLALRTVGRRFEFDTEVLIRAARAGIDVRSVPVRVVYAPPRLRRSHYRPVIDSVRIAWTVGRLTFGSEWGRRIAPAGASKDVAAPASRGGSLARGCEPREDVP